MKRQITTLIFILVAIISYSENITKQAAESIASNFIFGKATEIRTINTYGSDVNASIYIINFKPEGWAIISKNNQARPVIGYSPTGFFDTEEIKYNVKDWLNNQVEQIKVVDKNKDWSSEWNTLKKGKLLVIKSTSSVSPLLEVEWNQSSGWNRFCPAFSEGPDGKAYVGCVAVSMAQALFNAKYPKRPSGVKSYTLDNYGTVALDFDTQAAYQWDSMSVDESDDYNAQLLYNCAVAVEMNFSSDGSGAYTYRVPTALQKYFSFSPSVKNYNRYSDEQEWTTLLKNELRSGNVIIYSGDGNNGQAGHAFNIDGFSTNGYFHFNWGWSGSMNGYFSINNVAPGSSDFTKNQAAVVGISRPYWGPTDILLDKNTIAANLEAGSIVGNISVTDYSEQDSFVFEVYGGKLFQQSGYAPSKFYVENSTLKTLEPLTTSAYPEIATIKVTDSEKNTYEKRFEITVSESSALTLHPENRLSIYPNPTRESLHLIGNQTHTHYQIVDLTGKTLLSNSLESNTIDVSHLNKGLYILTTKDRNNKSYTSRFMKE